MEFSHIGHHCKASGCKQLDFLPFTCELCSNRYCLDHRKPESHKCNKTHLREGMPFEFSSTTINLHLYKIKNHQFVRCVP